MLVHREADVMVCDLMLPDGTAADLMDQLSGLKCDKTQVIVFSNHSTEALEPLRGHPQVRGCLMKERGLKELALMIEQTKPR
jgi:DNA-binding NarL/FixJ family response regulator